MPETPHASRFLVYSDVPPLGNEGANMAVLAHRVIRAIEPELAGVVTRAASSKYPRDQIGAGLEKPALLSWDCPGLGLRFIRGAARHRMDHLLLKVWAATHPQPAGLRDGNHICLIGPLTECDGVNHDACRRSLLRAYRTQT